MNSRMNLGDGFSIPQDKDFNFMTSWVPGTPQKPITGRSNPNPNPIQMDRYGNPIGGMSFQELHAFQGGGGYSQDMLNYNRAVTNNFNTVEQVNQNGGGGGYYLPSVAGLNDRNRLINHIAGSFTQSMGSEVAAPEFSNNNPQASLYDSALLNRAPTQSFMSMLNGPIGPNLHSQVDTFGNLLVGNQTQYPDSNLFFNENMSFQIPQYGNPLLSRPVYNLNPPPLQSEKYTHQTRRLESTQLSAVLNHSADDKRKNENHSTIQNEATGYTRNDLNLPAAYTRNDLNFPVADRQEKKNHGSFVTTIGNEVGWHTSNELLHSIVDSSVVEPTPSKELVDADKLNEEEIDLNKMPQQKSRRRKHRPKVIIEGKPKRTPKLATPANISSKETPSGKRKYVRKTILQNSEVQQTNPVRDVNDSGAEAKAKAKAKSCKRSLNFNIDNSGDEELDETLIQQDMQHVGLFNLNSSSQATESLNGRFHEKQQVEIGKQSGLLVGNKDHRTNCSYSSSLNQIPLAAESSHEPREGRCLENFNTIVRESNLTFVDSCQRSSKNGYGYMQENIHAEVGRIGFQMKNSCGNLNLGRQLMSQGIPQTQFKVLPDPNVSGSKRTYYQAIEQIPPFTSQKNECSKNSSNLGAGYMEAHKRKKIENDVHTNTYCLPSHIAAVENGLVQVMTNSGTDVNANRFASLMIQGAHVPHKSLGIPRRENSEVNKDWYAYNKAYGHHSPKQHISLEHSYTRRNGSIKPSTQGFNHYSDERCNFIPLTPPSKSLVIGNRQVVKAPEATVKPIQSKKLSDDRDRELQNRRYQQSSRKSKGLSLKNTYLNPIEEIVDKLKAMGLEDERNSHTKIHQQNALVLYKGDGAVVPYGGLELIKRPKPRPKVDLDPETNRIWNLLMGTGIEGDQGLDMGKEKWWEEERRVFRGRADSFIARMHLVQGDRRFSRWKGSVVDSVIGVFLTQNVSDHLSSSAFMSLAARFPRKTDGWDGAANILVEEPEVCVLNPNDNIRWHEKASPHPVDKQSSPTTNESERTSFGESSSQSLDEEGLSSQGSFDSSVVQANGGLRSYSSSSSEAEYPSGVCKTNTHGSSTNPNITNVTLFEDFFSDVNKSPLSQKGSNHIHPSGNGQKDLRTDRIDKLKIPTNLSTTKMQVGIVPSHDHPLYMTPDPLTLGIDSFRMFNQEYMYSLPSIAVGIQSSQHKQATGPHALSNMHSTHQDLAQSVHSATNDQLCENQQGMNKPLQRGVPSVNELVNPVEIFNTTHSSITERMLGANKGLGMVNKNQFSENKLSKSNSREQESSRVKASKQTNIGILKTKKAKAEDDKTIEWDSLRKEAQANGMKKERSRDAMDSLDYEAVRCADVKVISDAIKERGMNNMLAERMKAFLNRIVRDHGSIDLEWLRDAPPEKGKDYLLSIRGLGLKSVECVRLLTLHHLAFPVDTNVGRIAVRLGWVPLQPLPESLQLHLLELYPILESIQKYLWPRLCKLDQRTLYELHYQMITFGKVFCTKSKPNCNACPMRGECRHFASAFASARLALPGPEEKGIINTTYPIPVEIHSTKAINPMQLPPPENMIREGSDVGKSAYIIEEPATPEETPHEHTEVSESDIEDAFYEDPDEIPTIKLNLEEFSTNLQNYMQENMQLQEGDMSKALVALNAQAASLPTPKLKNTSRLRTEHQVYELPDSHPLLKEMDIREPDDPSPYLLAIWTPGETSNSVQPPEQKCNSQEPGKLCKDNTCFSCNSIRESNSQIVRGTLLIPCRTAMRGSFPLNGTYFQVNEVFADHESSLNPIHVPRELIWNLPRRIVYFGTSVTSIFKGLSTEGIQFCFWKGFVCVRGFEQKKRAPRPLMARLHFIASKFAKEKSRAEK